MERSVPPSSARTLDGARSGWATPLAMAGYLFVLAYAAAFVTYRVALTAGFG